VFGVVCCVKAGKNMIPGKDVREAKKSGAKRKRGKKGRKRLVRKGSKLLRTDRNPIDPSPKQNRGVRAMVLLTKSVGAWLKSNGPLSSFKKRP